MKVKTFEMPLAFFMANDEGDFNHYIEWLFTEKYELNIVDSMWRVTDVTYKQYKGDLDQFFKEWYDMPGIYTPYEKDEVEAVLHFEVQYTLEN